MTANSAAECLGNAFCCIELIQVLHAVYLLKPLKALTVRRQAESLIFRTTCFFCCRERFIGPVPIQMSITITLIKRDLNANSRFLSEPQQLWQFTI